MLFFNSRKKSKWKNKHKDADWGKAARKLLKGSDWFRSERIEKADEDWVTCN
jgi:hypothetical protein